MSVRSRRLEPTRRKPVPGHSGRGYSLVSGDQGFKFSIEIWKGNDRLDGLTVNPDRWYTPGTSNLHEKLKAGDAVSVGVHTYNNEKLYPHSYSTPVPGWTVDRVDETKHPEPQMRSSSSYLIVMRRDADGKMFEIELLAVFMTDSNYSGSQLYHQAYLRMNDTALVAEMETVARAL